MDGMQRNPLTLYSRNKLHPQTGILRIPRVNAPEALERLVRLGRVPDSRIRVNIGQATADGAAGGVDFDAVVIIIIILFLSAGLLIWCFLAFSSSSSSSHTDPLPCILRIRPRALDDDIRPEPPYAELRDRVRAPRRDILHARQIEHVDRIRVREGRVRLETELFFPRRTAKDGAIGSGICAEER